MITCLIAKNFLQRQFFYGAMLGQIVGRNALFGGYHTERVGLVGQLRVGKGFQVGIADFI